MQGDFATFYEAEAPRLVRSVALATGELALAEDAVAEAFARAWSRWPAVSQHERPVAWILRVALNLSHDRFRRRATERRKAPVVAREDVVHDPLPADQRLWQAVQSLPQRERMLIALRYVADLTQPEIADALGMPRGTVASGLNRARQRLAVKLGPQYQEEFT